jgi:hypothetical protein
VTADEGWRLLAAALAARSTTPPLLPERQWDGCPPLPQAAVSPHGPLTAALRIAAAVIGDRPETVVSEPASDGAAALWQAIALRRAGRFQEARRAFRERGTSANDARLFEQALVVLRAPGGGFRWAGEAAAQLAARGAWDPIWFVDACAAVHAGLLSRETAALLEEIQRAELQLLLGASAIGEP